MVIDIYFPKLRKQANRFSFYLGLFLFIFNTGSAVALTPEDGWWWNASESGRGFVIETQDTTVFIASFVYDDSGDAVWYTTDGVLDENDTFTAPMFQFEGGQCITCSYQSPELIGEIGMMTVQFTSESTARITWAGGTVDIERINFKLGEWQQQLLGEWMIVKGNPLFPVYSGERLTLTEAVGTGQSAYVSGFRTGKTNSQVIISELEGSGAAQYTYFALLDASSDSYHAFAFNFTGLNGIEGVYSVSDKSVPVESIESTLLSQGTPFIGKRYRGRSAVTQ